MAYLTKIQIQDGAGTDLTSTLNGSKQSLDVNVSNGVSFSSPTFVSSTAALGIGATYTSATFDTSNGMGYISASIFSATTLVFYFDESSDGTNWSPIESFGVDAGNSNEASHKSSGRYVRARVINGAVANAGGVSNLNILISASNISGSTEVSLVDNNGLSFSSISGGTGNSNLGVAQSATNYASSSINSTVTQLAAAGTFNGTLESIFNQQSFSILVTSDQPGTLTLNQYIDAAGVSLVSSIVFPILAGIPFARSGVLNGNYFKLLYTNNGASTTTTLRIDTSYGTIPSSTQLNNAPSAINEINGVVFNSTTKGVQQTALLPTQAIKDSGRNNTNYFMVNQILTTATDTLMSLTGYKGGVAVTATTTPAVVTTGKTYRIHGIKLTYVGTATMGTAHFTLRVNLGGVVAVTSPAITEWVIGTNSTTAGNTNTTFISLPEGIEIPAGAGVGVSMQGFGVTGTAAVAGYGLCSLIGFEY